MKTFLKILTFIWIALFVFLGISMLLETPKQISRDKTFIEEEIKPSVDFVKDFYSKNKRLPTNREFFTWERDYYKDYTSDLTLPVDSLIPGLGRVQYIRQGSDVVTDDLDKFKNANWEKDFAIGVWRGDWWEYYFSWSDSYDTNNYSLYGGIISSTVIISIGLSPLLLWWWINRRKK